MGTSTFGPGYGDWTVTNPEHYRHEGGRQHSRIDWLGVSWRAIPATGTIGRAQGPDPRVQRITRNLLNRCLGKKS
ncbi:hypothetical protein [Paenibacillus mendelii]|uniref:Uncharacterized protein n=1 Tax=Paenibacillus mendelii TaxID=206163 RepID=A0ABV6JBT7_9BACL|nr:hypothetical protein [Paenibacillus mendelii]MCQ6562619.1 hypothetical protein [Paenibacillus mendelii]